MCLRGAKKCAREPEILETLKKCCEHGRTHELQALKEVMDLFSAGALILHKKVHLYFMGTI